MNIAIVGYGKMGQIIESIALKRQHSIVSKIDLHNQSEINELSNLKVDVAIEFTTPDTAVHNIKACIDQGIPIVCGTTGWYSKLSEIEAYCESRNGTFLYASNFSLGVNVLFEINRKLASIMNRMNNYSVKMKEIHHVHKKDAPSGTAITLAEEIIGCMDRIRSWQLGDSDTQKLGITSIREKNVPGTHEVKYEDDIDEISIKHVAKNRKGFGLGAVLVSEWIKDRKGFHTMKDFLDL